MTQNPCLTWLCVHDAKRLLSLGKAGIMICMRHHPKATSKTRSEVNTTFKKQWNRENLMLFGPKLNDRSKQFVSGLPSNSEPQETVSEQVTQEALLFPVEPAVIPPAGHIPAPAKNLRIQESQAEIADNYRKKLQVILQFPFQPAEETSSVTSAQVKAMGEITEFGSSHGLYHRAYPSISKILEKSRPPESEYFLTRWKKNMQEELGEEGFRQHQQETFDRGSTFHHCVMQVLQGLPAHDVHVPTNVEGLWHSLAPVLPDLNVAQAVEAPVKHPMLHYSGLFDCLASYKGSLCLIDWKVSKKQKPSLGNTFDSPLQLAAYMGALNVDSRYHMQVRNGLLVIAYEDGQPAHAHTLAPQQCVYYWGQWLRRLHTFWAGVLDGSIVL